MPRYEYRCTACGATVELSGDGGPPDVSLIQHCHRVALKRIFTGAFVWPVEKRGH